MFFPGSSGFNSWLHISEKTMNPILKIDHKIHWYMKNAYFLHFICPVIQIYIEMSFENEQGGIVENGWWGGQIHIPYLFGYKTRFSLHIMSTNN